VRELTGRRFALNPMGESLRSDVPGSLRAMAIMLGEGWHSAAWSALLHSVRTGEPAFEHVHDASLFDWLPRHPEAATCFHRAMTSLSTTVHGAVVAACDFSEARTIVDVGGGEGMLLASILKANPRATGILFDRPEIASGARAHFVAKEVLERC